MREDSPGGISWLSSSLKIVGLYFGDENARAKSWDEVTAKFNSVLKKWESRFLTLRGKKTVIESLAVSTIWHVAKVYPPSREVIDTIQSAIWKFVWSKKPELVRRETCTSGYAAGGLGIVDVGSRSKALLIGRLFRLLDAEQPDCAWKELMRYYVNRMLGFNDNTRPNCDIPTPFYSHFLRVLREFNVDISCRRSSHAFYGEKIRNCVTPVRARCEDIWNRQLGPG
jgi:hypothetical protein